MPHLLIDRFRFEPVAPGSGEAGSNLLTRFGERIYLFFVITPPASLVERAWNRGIEVGRYKAVDDTLAHGIEAYTGIPELLFTWVERKNKRLVFEFVDNSVGQGFVAASFGAALIPSLAASLWGNEFAVLRFQAQLPPRVIGLAWLRDLSSVPAARVFVATTRKIVARLWEGGAVTGTENLTSLPPPRRAAGESTIAI
jgi:hypothetical protein